MLAGIVNRTINEKLGDLNTLWQVTYLLTTLNVWHNVTCRGLGCLVHLDTSRAFKGTYTTATYNPQLGFISITMKFNSKWIGYLLLISFLCCQFSLLLCRYCHLHLLYSGQQCWRQCNHIDTGQFYTGWNDAWAFPTYSRSDVNRNRLQPTGLLETGSCQCRTYPHYRNIWC